MLTFVGWFITGDDILRISSGAAERCGADFARRADDAARLTHHAIGNAAVQAMASEVRAFTAKKQAALARTVSAAAQDLLRAIQGSTAAAPDGLPPALAFLWEHASAIVPPHRPHASALERAILASPLEASLAAIERKMLGSPWWAELVRTRTEMERGPPPGAMPATMTAEEAKEIMARLPPPTAAQEAAGRAQAAIFTGLTMLMDGLAIVTALADAAEQQAAEATARDSRESNQRGGRRPDPFAGGVMRGLVRAYYTMFGVWPRGRPDNAPAGRPDAREWGRAILRVAHANLDGGAGDSAFVAERLGGIAALGDTRFGDLIIAAVSAETEALR